MGDLVTVSSPLALTAEAQDIMRLPYDAALTDDQADVLRPYLNVTLAQPERVTSDDVRLNLGPLAATLPMPRIGGAEGKLKLGVYAAILVGCPRPAFHAACVDAAKTLNWFPTPKQLLDRIEAWTDTDAARLAAIKHRLKQHDAAQRLLPARPLTQSEVDAFVASGNGKAFIGIGVACGAIVKDDQGRYRPAGDGE